MYVYLLSAVGMMCVCVCVCMYIIYIVHVHAVGVGVHVCICIICFCMPSGVRAPPPKNGLACLHHTVQSYLISLKYQQIYFSSPPKKIPACIFFSSQNSEILHR